MGIKEANALSFEMVLVFYGLVLGLFCEYFAISWAYAEVQIEGPNSWARGLPCWRKKYAWFPKEITGYHVSMASLLASAFLLAFTAVIIAGLISDIELVARMLKVFGLIVEVLFSISVLGIMHEDFLWNVLNPSDKFGVKDFTKKYPEVGKTVYIWIVPIDYILMTLFSFLLAYAIGGAMIAIWIGIYLAMLTITLALAGIRYKKDLGNNQ